MPAPGHVVLLGDSIFDNARHVSGEPDVVKQVEACLPQGWRATLLAIDGDVTTGVARQLTRLPIDATHLFVSVGGNDALGESYFVRQPASSVAEVMTQLHTLQSAFRDDYRAMLRSLLAAGRPATVCTVYDAIPGLLQPAVTALGAFNEVILREAIRNRLPVIDLRLTCDQPADYSPLSPIEPSAAGGEKVARAVAEVATTHDFSHLRTTIYI
jgi:lysophospholipase L1-like esterase